MTMKVSGGAHSLVLLMAAVLVCLGCTAAELPPLWDQAPDSLDDFPIEDGNTVIDAWNYTHRLGMYKLMLNVTYDVMRPLGAGNRRNFIWGFALFYGGHYSSGRLNNFDSEMTNCPDNGEASTESENLCISVTSWWAVTGYGFSAIPFMGAVQAGYFSDWPHEIVLSAPDIQSREASNTVNQTPLFNDFCTTVDECITGVYGNETQAWADFFIYLRQLESTFTMSEDFDRNEYEDGILARMWDAHMVSAYGSRTHAQGLLRFLSGTEASFATGWVDFTSFLAAARWAATFDAVARKQANIFPKRVLTDDDRPPFISDFTAWENQAVMYISSIPSRGAAVYEMWRSAMCTPGGREIGRRILDTGIEHPLTAALAINQLFWYTMFNSCPNA